MDKITILTNIVTILVPLASLLWFSYNRLDKKILAFRKESKEDTNEIKLEIKEMRDDIKSIDQRLSRLEGAFLERGQWEGKMYAMQRNSNRKE